MRHWIALLTTALAITPAGVASAAPISLLLLGDSITQGTTSEPTGPSFATLLTDSLGAGFEVTNIGCGGASARDWSPTSGDSICGGLSDPILSANLYPALAEPNLPADLVMILLGTNDAIGFLEPAPPTSAEYRSALDELVTQILFDGAGAVLLATPPPNFAIPLTMPLLLSYAEEIFDLCGAAGDAIHCGPDVLSLLEPEDFEDGQIHPNASGHAKIADAMYASIVLAVPEPGTAGMLALGLLVLARRRRPSVG